MPLSIALQTPNIYYVAMVLPDRDRAVVSAVARFGQMSSKQIYELIFSDTSQTPCDRALRRLTAYKYLNRIERRMVGGLKGGSGQYVYQLGRRGFFLFNTGRYNPARAVNYHSIAIVDSYLILRRLEADGALQILGYSTEPDCWVTIDRNELKPDMFVEIQTTEPLKLWLEVDMATEGQRQIKDKLVRYWRAFNDADSRVWPEFPLIVFVAVDDERAKELRWLIDQGAEQAQELFRVTTKDKLHTLFL